VNDGIEAGTDDTGAADGDTHEVVATTMIAELATTLITELGTESGTLDHSMTTWLGLLETTTKAVDGRKLTAENGTTTGLL
jgi:hypothetical protein